MQLTHHHFRNKRQSASSHLGAIAKPFTDAIKCFISAYTCYQPDSPALPSPTAKTWRYGRSINN